MGFFDQLGVGGILGGVSSVLGLIQAERQKRDALAARQAAINAYQQASNQAYLDTLSGGQRSLYGAAGTGADALHALAGSMGSNLAAGGVYNASAVGGALALGQRELGSNLADLAAQNYARAQQLRTSGMQNVAQMQLGAANTDVQQAYENLGTYGSGLQSFLQAASQAALARSGANVHRMSLPMMNGTQNQAPSLPGNAVTGAASFNLPQMPTLGSFGPHAATGYAGFPSSSMIRIPFQPYKNPDYFLPDLNRNLFPRSTRGR